jgi:hypothetical protein
VLAGFIGAFRVGELVALDAEDLDAPHRGHRRAGAPSQDRPRGPRAYEAAPARP